MRHPSPLSQTTTATNNAKPTTMIRLVAKRQGTSLAPARRRDLLPPCLASMMPGGGPGSHGVPQHAGSAALGNRQASSPVAASSPPPQQQRQQQQQHQNVGSPTPRQQQAPPSPWQQQQLQWQRQQQLWRQQQQQRQPQQQPLARPPFAPQQQPLPRPPVAPQQEQGQRDPPAWQQRQQQQPATTLGPPPPPPPPSLVLPRTAVVAPAPTPPPDPPSLVVPRAGLMTLEERRAAFSRAALRADASARAKEVLYHGGGAAGGKAKKLSEGEQRTDEWHALRDARLTASAFGNALGFWPGGRASLWEEKVGLGKAFRGNPATRWGTEAEPRALEAYVAAVVASENGLGATTSAAAAGSVDDEERQRQKQIRRVSECRFEVLSEDDAHDWLGASPDGLIDVESFLGGGEGDGGSFFVSPPSGVAGGGVLEIKCPFNRGRPEEATPWAVPPHYYVPQVQGLMAVTGREWCDLWCWTPGGSGNGGVGGGASRFRFERDRGYWALAFEVLADFWWAHVVPANQAASRAGKGGDRREATRPFRPAEEHSLTKSLVERSRAAAEAAAEAAAGDPRGSFFSAGELEEAVERMKRGV